MPSDTFPFSFENEVQCFTTPTPSADPFRTLVRTGMQETAAKR